MIIVGNKAREPKEVKLESTDLRSHPAAPPSKNNVPPSPAPPNKTLHPQSNDPNKPQNPSRSHQASREPARTHFPPPPPSPSSTPAPPHPPHHPPPPSPLAPLRLLGQRVGAGAAQLRSGGPLGEAGHGVPVVEPGWNPTAHNLRKAFGGVWLGQGFPKHFTRFHRVPGVWGSSLLSFLVGGRTLVFCVFSLGGGGGGDSLFGGDLIFLGETLFGGPCQFWGCLKRKSKQNPG